MYKQIQMGDISDKAFRIASDWWFNRIIGKDQYKDNGDNGFHSVLSGILGQKIADKHPVDETKREAWFEALKKHAATSLETFREVYLKVDYDPCYLLHYMLKETGIDRSRLPIKTTMRIAFDDRGDGVWLNAGYGAPSEYVCDLTGTPPTKRWVVNYKSVHPEFVAPDGTVFPERKYDQEFHAYTEWHLNQFLNRDDWGDASTHPDDQANPYNTFMSKSIQAKVDGAWVDQ